MNKIVKFILLFPIIISGCSSNENTNNLDNQRFERFNMNIFSDEGVKTLSIQSANSTFNKERNIFNLKETTIYLFKGKEKEYIISSDNAKLSNNNLVELDGNVSVNTLLQNDETLIANRFLWNVNKSEYLLNGNVVFESNDIYLSSDKAILNKDNNIIEFFNPVKYIIKDSNNESSYEINSENAYYNIENKSVSFGSKEQRVRSKIYF